jgi:hypothetical protein
MMSASDQFEDHHALGAVLSRAESFAADDIERMLVAMVRSRFESREKCLRFAMTTETADYLRAIAARAF